MRQAFTFATDDFQEVLLVSRIKRLEFLPEHFGIQEYGRQRGSQIMGYHVQNVALDKVQFLEFGALGGFGMFALAPL